MGMAILGIFSLSALTANWAYAGHDLRSEDFLLNYATGAVSVLLGLMFSTSVMIAVNHGLDFELNAISIISIISIFVGALFPIALGIGYARFSRVAEPS